MITALSAMSGNSAVFGEIANALPTTGLIGLWESDSVVTSGSNVTQINDKVGTSNLTTDSGSPQLVGDAVVFDGIDDSMFSTFSPPATSAALIVVAKFVGSGKEYVGFGKNAFTQTFALGKTPDEKLALYANTSLRLASTGFINATSFFCGSLTGDATQYQIFINGVANGTISTTYGVTGTNLRVGRNIRGSATYNSIEFKAMAIYNNISQHAAAVAFLMNKYGI